MELLRVAGLFAITAVAEIVGCYLPWLVLREGKSAWLLLPGAPMRPMAACTSPWPWRGCTGWIAWR